MQVSASPRSVAVEPKQSTRVADRYVLLDKLGAGGMGAVHRAQDETTGRIVAFKQLHSSLAGQKRRTLEALFEREYHTLVRLKHPRIIEVYDFGVAAEGPYYTMELLDGKDLHQLAPLPYREACSHLRDVASSLALVHAHRLVHRDVSPRNVRLTPDGRAKLIDFGALATFGPASEVIGTAVCMAPEALRGMPVDQRADLYALGAVAYWALTGRHAYPARSIQELPQAWRKAPPPPSELVVGIPPALDTLVMSLLSLEPLARPASAAAVIDQLTAIAELDPEEHEQGAESYLLSGRMAGRQGELEWVQRRIMRALKGQGAEVVLEGPTGIGKTRLLQEIGLEAQLRGVTVLKADAQATPGPFGVATALGVQLLNACPEIARQAAGSHAALLGHLSEQLRDKLEVQALVALAQDPGERRARAQTALHEWFLAAARERVLLLAVDNLQAADDNSAAFLAALGREARQTQLVVLVTQRKGDPIVAPIPVKALRKRSGQLKLAALSAEGCAELVQSLFGDAANSGRVAQILYEKSAGNPQQCMDLVHLLVKKKIAKYVTGTWVLPFEVSGEELPSRVEEILAAKLSGLSKGARELAQALSIEAKPVSIEHCLTRVEGQSERQTFEMLDELVGEQILLIDGGKYRFGQEALREALLGQMDEAQRRAGHLRAAETLLTSAGENVDLRIEAGWHLLRAGEEGRGADIMAAAARELLRKEDGEGSVEQAVQALRAALTVYEKQGRSDYEIAGLLFPMIPLAYYTGEWRFILEYGERAVTLGLKITGLGLAQKLSSMLGKKLGLMIGLVIASIGFARQKKRGLRYDLREAIGSFCGLVPAAVGTANICYDIEKVRRLTQLLEPFTLFGPDHIAGLMHAFAVGQLKMGQSEELEGREVMERLIERFDNPKVMEVLGEGHFKLMQGGMLFSLGVLYPFEFGDRALDGARQLETLGVRVWAMAADQVRLLYHALRGESEHTQRYRDRVELFAVQGSTTWQAEMFWPVLLLGAEVQTGDTIAVRRISEQLERRAADAPSLRVYAEAARAAYLALRGDLKEAIALYEKILPELAPRRRVAWSSVRAFFAEALNWAGEHQKAKQVAQEVLALTRPEDHVIVGRYLEPQRQLALAEAGLGNYVESVRILDDLLKRHGRQDNPLLVGLLHKARAQVALLMLDQAAFDEQLSAMEQRFFGTKNPALIAQWERLCEQAIRAGVRVASDGPGEGHPTPSKRDVISTVHRTLSEINAAPDRYRYALDLILLSGRAKSGYLYRFDNDAMILVAASSPQEPLREHEAQLLEQARRLVSEALEADEHTLAVVPEKSEPPAFATAGDHEIASSDAAVKSSSMRATPSLQDADKTVFVDSILPIRSQSSYRVIVLSTWREGSPIVVGGAILELSPQRDFALSHDLLEGISAALYERHSTTATMH